MVTEMEHINNIERYSKRPNINLELIYDQINFVLKKINDNIKEFGIKFPEATSKNKRYGVTDNVDWTSSFWTGMLWLAYEVSGDIKYKNVAKSHLESFKQRIENRYYTDTHDLGFLYTLSCVAAYKLTKNFEAKETAIEAANLLLDRYFSEVGIIQAWGKLDDPIQRGRVIIDSSMNLPLLYWASDVTNDKKYYNAAYNHISNLAKYNVRDDGSTYHSYFINVSTGEPIGGKTVQGYSDDSCWARGQAWGIYGFILSYIYTRDPKFLKISQAIANYFLNRLPNDYVCFWDLIFNDEISLNEEKDSSAAAIAACGLLELSKNIPYGDPYKGIYENSALSILKSLIDNYTSKECPESNGLLLHAVYSKPDKKGIDECCIWGDYFYFEALIRLIKNWKMYW